jgi:branched-chain amino acid transport system permease protein
MLAAALYALIAGGLSFLYATTRIFHLAHGVVVMAGGYAFWYATQVLHWEMFLAGLFSIATAAALGVLMNELVYEVLRRRGARGISYLIATLALLLFGTACILLLFGAAPHTFHFQTRSLEWGGAYVTLLQLWMIGIAVILLSAYGAIVYGTKFGKAMRATADNEMVAEILGIPTHRIRIYAFALSSVLAAAAGVLIGLEFNLDPNMGIFLAIQGFAAAVIGGVGSFGGALLGALILGGIQQAAVWYLGAGWRHAVTFLLLFLFLIFVPSGIVRRNRTL